MAGFFAGCAIGASLAPSSRFLRDVARTPDLRELVSTGGSWRAGSTIRGPKGKVTLKKQDLKALDLKPGKGTEPDSGGEQLVLLRAYLAKFPHTIFPPAKETLAVLKLKKPRMLIVTEEFQHVGDADDVPSKSKTYASLAEAIAACGAKKFVAGKDNTDWRKHLVR